LSAAGARLYAMGKFYWNQRTETGNAKSIRYFEQVVQSDPRDGRGYAGLASAYAIEADYKFGPLTRQAALTRASGYAFKALAIDPRSAEAHAALGLVASDRQQMAQSVSEYRRALALDPYYAPAHQWYGIALLLSGKGASAYAELQKAANLDPESVAATDWLSQAAFIARRYRDAIAYGHQALDLSPQRYSAYVTLGMAYEALGNYQAAISAYEKYSATCRECRYDAAALLAHVYAVTHDKMRAEQQLKVAESGIALHETSGDNVVAALIALGRKNEALELLRRLKPDEPGALLAIDPRMDAVRGDSRFRQYVQGPG
jgi:tetratricopeptide (TPR) repeat protein